MYQLTPLCMCIRTRVVNKLLTHQWTYQLGTNLLICTVLVEVPRKPEVPLEVDFAPLSMDNAEFEPSREEDKLLELVVNDKVANCGKHTYADRQIGVGWDELIWSKRWF